MASTEADLHPAVRAAARGELPPWAQAGERRRAHMGRVAALLGEWAEALDLSRTEQQRWRAAGWLHDSLRDADPRELRPTVPASFADLAGSALHGPAAAERLGDVSDPELLRAVRYHTLGHPEFDSLGRALYLADFMEPGRTSRAEWLASLRDRMPEDRDAVLVEVVAARIHHLLERRSPVRPETAAFWNHLVNAPR